MRIEKIAIEARINKTIAVLSDLHDSPKWKEIVIPPVNLILIPGDLVKSYGYGTVEEYTGHGVGSKLHEDPAIPNFGPAGHGPILRPGMTLAIEPMINLGTKRIRVLKDGWTAVTRDDKNSAHFEHSIVITEDGYEILTIL